MPGDSLAVAGHLAEEVRAPGDHVVAQKVFHVRDDPRVREQVIDTAVAQVRGADGIAIAAGGEGLREEFVEVRESACAGRTRWTGGSAGRA